MLKRKVIMNLLIKSFLVLVVLSLAVFLIVQIVDNNVIRELISSEELHDNDMDNEQTEEEKVSIINGYKAIQLDNDIIIASGLAFEKLKSMTIKPEFMAYAEVVDVSPLVALKTQYEDLVAERNIIQNALSNQNKILERAEALHKVKSLSTRELEKNRADRNQKAAELNAYNTRVNSFIYSIKSSWGEQLASLILDKERQNEFDLLATYQESLILLSLPKNKLLDHQQQNAYVSNLNQRVTAQAVTYLDRAKQVNNSLYGESFFYLLESEKVRAGMRLFAWIEETENKLEGYFVTDNAIIWYANEPWVYVKHGEDLFIRKPLGPARRMDDGWLLETNLLADDELLVTKGGQTLLSEEFKWAIPDENDD